jgi:hypothetical protein
MRKISVAKSVPVAAVAVVCGGAASSWGAPVYLSDTTNPAVSQHQFIGGPNGNAGIGDDYNTGMSSVLLTGLSFYGGLSSSQTNTSLGIEFFNLTGVKVAEVYPGNSEVLGYGSHTLTDSDFIQNGTTGITIPGSGYIIFDPYSAAISGPNGVTLPTPNPTFVIGVGPTAAPTIGTNDNTILAEVSDTNVFTTGRYAYGFGTIAQDAQFTLTSTAVVPEPASLGLIAAGASFSLIRRRRAGRAS